MLMALGLSGCSAALTVPSPVPAIDSAITAVISFTCSILSSRVSASLHDWQLGVERAHPHATPCRWQVAGEPLRARADRSGRLVAKTPQVGHANLRRPSFELPVAYRASGSGRIWKCTTFGEFSLPPS